MEQHHTHRHIDTNNLNLLARMDDFQVAKSDPDPRGWDVVAKDGTKIGTVDHLLVDPSARRVRYLGVDVDSKLMPNRKQGDHLAVPIENARLDDGRARHRVVIPQMSSDLGTLAVYHRGSVESMRTRGQRPQATHGRKETDGKMTLKEEKVAVGKREAKAGEVEVTKHVEKEKVHETVPVRHEEVTVERRPVTGQNSASTDTSWQDEEIRIPLSREEVVVEKRTVPKEEIVVRKHEETDREQVDATVRKERADVRKTGDVRETGRTATDRRTH